MPNIIASLTSFPGRIGTVHQAIQTILNQSVRPDRVILYLACEQFPARELPQTLHDLIREHPSFEVRWCRHDIRSFKKLVPALRDFPNDIIVTFDDDILYPPTIIERLVEKHHKHPNAICGCRVKRIRIKNHEIENYRNWSRYRTLRSVFSGVFPQYRNIATTGGGALFPPHVLHPDVLREDIFMNLCPTTDDLWFWAMAVHNGAKTAPAGRYLSINVIKDSQTERLCTNNLRGENLNDKNMKRILATYPSIYNSICEHKQLDYELYFDLAARWLLGVTAH